MENSKHIFLQVDTDSIIAGLGSGVPTNSQVRLHTLIYDQGSMALGNQIENFVIDVISDLDILFTILPLQLFSNHKLYFTEFKLLEPHKGISIPDDIILDGHEVSFKVPIKQVEEGGIANFCLYAIIEYQILKETVRVPICIDPVLRVKQG